MNDNEISAYLRSKLAKAASRALNSYAKRTWANVISAAHARIARLRATYRMNRKMFQYSSGILGTQLFVYDTADKDFEPQPFSQTHSTNLGSVFARSEAILDRLAYESWHAAIDKYTFVRTFRDPSLYTRFTTIFTDRVRHEL